MFYKKLILLFLIAICCVGSAYGADGRVNAIDGNFNAEKGAEVEIDRQSKIGKDGRIINMSDKFSISKSVETQIGSNTSEEKDEATGAIHNHDTITISSSGKIEGDGSVFHYAGFIDDEAIRDEYTVADYEAEQHLDDPEKLGRATYYDLVNDSKVTKFMVYHGGQIITPAQTLTDHGDGTYVIPQISVVEEPIDLFSDAAAIDMGSARRYYESGYTLTTHSEKQQDIRASFFSLSGYTQYAQKVTKGNGISDRLTEIETVSQPSSDDSVFKFNLTNEGGENGLSYTPVFIPVYDETLTISKTGTTSEYTDAVRQNASVLKFEDWTPEDPVVEHKGDNSWYNGVFELKEGGAIISSEGAIFGGKTVVHECTELEWQGGAKDEFNRPTIIMRENSALYFNLQDELFSFYGSIEGPESAKLVFEKGTVLIKGDLSKFKGKVIVVKGANFEVRSSDAESSSEYTGKFPEGVIYQTEANGELATAVVSDLTATTIDTATGVQNLAINNGYTVVKNTEGGGGVTLNGSSIGKGAFVSVDGESEVKNNKIEGVLIAKGDMKAENVTINGGVLAIEKGSLTTENLTAGSTIVLWGNTKIDSVNIQNSGSSHTGTSFTITDGHTLKFYADVNPAGKQIDNINTLDSTIVHSGNGMQIGGLNFLNRPSADEYYFDVLSGAAVNSTPITIGAIYGSNPATFVLYEGAAFSTTSGSSPPSGTESGTDFGSDVIYTYTATKTPIPVTLSNGVGIVDIDGKRYYIYGSEQAGPGKILMTTIPRGSSSEIDSILPIETIHLSGLNAISSIYDMITEYYGYIEKEEIIKYNFWNKTFAGIDKYSTIDSLDVVKAHDYGTIFGLDAKPTQLRKYDTFVMPTIFGGMIRRNVTYNSSKARQEEYMVGGKFALFNRRINAELITSYGFIRTKATPNPLDIKDFKSHIFSIGSKFGFNIQAGRYVVLHPDILTDYSFIKTAKVGNSLIENVRNGNINRIDVVPGLSLVYDKKSWRAILSAKYYRRFGTKPKITTDTVVIKNVDKLKKGYIEYAIDITKHNPNKGKFGIKLAKTTHGVNGFKATVKAGIKF
ncbi:MAG: hypothetical protein LBB34_01550 [Holosporales bacterium]|jgi:hypothetical protein|nr:hypothetical protein [Holosporales bacterium]